MASAVQVSGRRLMASRHALLRYQQRVKPALGVGDAMRDLRQVIRFGEVRDVAPGWASDDEGAECWVMLGEGIAFPVREGHLMTCLTIAAPGEEVREARNEARKDRSERRKARGFRTEHGKVAREARARRREQRGGVDG